MEQFNPPHPGQMIKEVYIEPFDIGANEIALKMGINKSTFNRLLNQKSSMTPEMALRISIVIGRSPESWLAMQSNYDLWYIKKSLNTNELEPISFAI